MKKTGFFANAKRKTQISFAVRGNREADQRLCFRYTDSTIPLLPKWHEIHCPGIFVTPNLLGVQFFTVMEKRLFIVQMIKSTNNNVCKRRQDN